MAQNIKLFRWSKHHKISFNLVFDRGAFRAVSLPVWEHDTSCNWTLQRTS